MSVRFIRPLRCALLASALLFGLQFLLPHTVHAMDHLAVLEEGNVPLIGLEEESDGAGALDEIGPLAMHDDRSRSLWMRQCVPITLHQTGERTIVALLCTSGLQPSAP